MEVLQGHIQCMTELSTQEMALISLNKEGKNMDKVGTLIAYSNY